MNSLLPCAASSACMGLLMLGLMSWIDNGIPHYLSLGDSVTPVHVLVLTIIAFILSVIVGGLFAGNNESGEWK